MILATSSTESTATAGERVLSQAAKPLSSETTTATLFPWYGIRTKSNCEKVVASVLEGKGYAPLLATYTAQRRWSDRKVETVVPLFPGYVFCRLDVKCLTPVLSSPGVVSVVGFAKQPAPIPDSEIEAVQALLKTGWPVEACPFLREGQRVRITRGALAGLEGILLKKKAAWKFIVSVDLLQRSVAVEIDPDHITAASPMA